MNFFKNITDLNVPGIWNITIHADADGNMVVSTLFTQKAFGDNASKAIPPLLLKGTAIELDEGYFEAISAPVQQTAGLLTNMEEYLKGVEKAKQASRMQQDKKPVEKKAKAPADDIEVSAPIPNKEDLRKAYIQKMIEVNELNAACKYEEAIALLPSVTDYPEKEKELTTKLADLTRKKEQLGKALELFNA